MEKARRIIKEAAASGLEVGFVAHFRSALPLTDEQCRELASESPHSYSELRRAFPDARVLDTLFVGKTPKRGQSVELSSRQEAEVNRALNGTGSDPVGDIERFVARTHPGPVRERLFTGGFGFPIGDVKAARADRTMSCCPFCQSEIQADTVDTRYYDCGTRVNRRGTVQYDKRCS